jgi:hypothetical protein
MIIRNLWIEEYLSHIITTIKNKEVWVSIIIFSIGKNDSLKKIYRINFNMKYNQRIYRKIKFIIIIKTLHIRMNKNHLIILDNLKWLTKIKKSLLKFIRLFTNKKILIK